MIELHLPKPWPANTIFRFDDSAAVTWLVGANGTGKSRFLRALRDHTSVAPLKPRLISTDRLSVARQDETSRGMFGDWLGGGLQKGRFAQFISANHRDGAISGTITLLYERPDLRIRVEATLSQLLDRHIKLEMTDGNLTPKVRCGTSPEYGMLSDECHGVLELLVLLANIYDEDTRLLLIDEPEQHLHPQYQAFVLGELQRSGKKAILATHSPSFLAIKTLDDLRGVVCLHHDFRPPSTYRGEPHIDREVAEVLPRMTEQHRAFFFAHSPVFVEGYFDAAVIAAIQRSLGLSAEAAGSCLIPAMGKEEAGRYLMLCNALGKKACFLFDLDALFDRRLRIGALQDSDLAVRIADAGHGELGDMMGRLQRSLTDAVKTIEGKSFGEVPAQLAPLRQFFVDHAGADNLDRRRLAVLVTIAERFDDVRQAVAEAEQIRGLLRAVLDHLSRSDIHLLAGGALENYLPSYTGDRFKILDENKRPVAIAEQAWLATKRSDAEIIDRYGDLATVVHKLPSRRAVDVRPTLRRELPHLLHHLILNIRSGQLGQAPESAAPDPARANRMALSALAARLLGEEWRRVANFVELSELNVRSRADFDGVLVIRDRFGIGEHTCRFDNQTQTNNPDGLPLSLAPKAEPGAT